MNTFISIATANLITFFINILILGPFMMKELTLNKSLIMLNSKYQAEYQDIR